MNPYRPAHDPAHPALEALRPFGPLAHEIEPRTDFVIRYQRREFVITAEQMQAVRDLIPPPPPLVIPDEPTPLDLARRAIEGLSDEDRERLLAAARERTP
jgi:hypothetical protein